ncbi:hypothetical protein M8494_37995 (plasmid) [Serratia ureilytica]
MDLEAGCCEHLHDQAEALYAMLKRTDRRVKMRVPRTGAIQCAEAMAGCRGAARPWVLWDAGRVRGITNDDPVPERTPGNSKKPGGTPGTQSLTDTLTVHNSTMGSTPPSVTAAPCLSMDRNTENAQDEM